MKMNWFSWNFASAGFTVEDTVEKNHEILFNLWSLTDSENTDFLERTSISDN